MSEMYYVQDSDIEYEMPVQDWDVEDDMSKTQISNTMMPMQDWDVEDMSKTQISNTMMPVQDWDVEDDNYVQDSDIDYEMSMQDWDVDDEITKTEMSKTLQGCPWQVSKSRRQNQHKVFRDYSYLTASPFRF